MNMYICTVYVYIHMFMYIFKYQSFIVLSEQLVDFIKLSLSVPFWGG